MDCYEKNGNALSSSFNHDLLSLPFESLHLEPPSMIGGTSTIRQVMQLMHEQNAPAVLVCEHKDGPIQGVLTERDVLRAFELGWDPDKRTIREIMQPNPFCLGPWDSIGFALKKLVEIDCSHLPIIDLDGRPSGLLSRRHLLNFISKRAVSTSQTEQAA